MMKFKYIIALIALGLTFSSCEKLLDVDPKQSIDSSEALTTKEGIDAALISVYSRLQNYTLYGRDYLALSEALSDNAKHTAYASHLMNEAANIRGAHFASWQLTYYAVNQMNLILEALDKQNFDANWKANTLGQVYFLRALCYHDLLRCYTYDPTANISQYNYGGVPLMLIGVDDVTKTSSLSRPTVEAAYAQIYDDLTKAHQNLSISNSTTIHKATKAAVSALFSRVALYKGDYDKAVEMANQAITETSAVFSTNANFLADWRKEVHPESIFELKFNISENVGSDRSLRATYTSRATYDATVFTIQAVVAVDPSFYTLYAANDVRRGLIRNGAGKASGNLEMYKFISKSGTPGLDNVPIIRLSEVYLNRAEAYYHLGALQYANAALDLNKMRNRAGLNSVNLTGTALLDEILVQRRLEMAFEGHRWFDLKRNGLDIIKSTGNLLFTDYRMLAPIPEREINASKNTLKQNFNY